MKYQGTFVKATLTPDGTGRVEFVVYVNEGDYFRAPLGIGARATGCWDIDKAHLLEPL